MSKQEKFALKYAPGNIESLQKASGLSVDKWAQKIGLTFHVVRGVMQRINKPSIATLIHLANACAVSMDWLCSDNGHSGFDD